MSKQAYVYILCSKRNGTLYIGVTSDIIRRVWQHKNKVVEGFTKKYNVDKLGYFKVFNDIAKVIEREKELKKLKTQIGLTCTMKLQISISSNLLLT